MRKLKSKEKEPEGQAEEERKVQEGEEGQPGSKVKGSAVDIFGRQSEPVFAIPPDNLLFKREASSANILQSNESAECAKEKLLELMNKSKCKKN